MPLPKPQADESQDDFISRCMSELAEEFDDEDQRAAVCHEQWRDKEKTKMERKTVKFEVKAIDEETGIFEAYGSTFSQYPDAYGDICDPGCFTKTITEGSKRIKVLWNHNVNEPIGKPVDLHEDEKGLFVKAKLSLGVQRAREVLSLMKDGVINEMSIGYETVKQSMVNGIRHLQEVKLYDVSPVTFAANPEALVTSVKNTDEALEQLKQAIAVAQALLKPEGKGAVNDTLPTEDLEAANLESAIAALTAYSEGVDVRDAEAKIDAILATLK